MRYCRKCVLPDTRPGLNIDASGVCSGCIGHDSKSHAIDWEQRARELERIIAAAKSVAGSYDCLVPVSGGKDSTWQVVNCLQYDLRVLAVSWRSPGRNQLGQKNLENLIALGVDHIDYTINPKVEKLFLLKALEQTGNLGIPMHMAIFAIPLKLASVYQIPLVIWGESPDLEYGGNAGQRSNDRLDSSWLSRHGILQGTSIKDWLAHGFSAKQLVPYFLPDSRDFVAQNICSIFLGYYLPWDPLQTLQVASKHGFQVRTEGPKVGYYNYADIDCNFMSIHHYFKWPKFGFTRLFDNLSLEIRNQRMTREDAIEIIRQYGVQKPEQDIKALCHFLGISRQHFAAIEDSFRNKDIWFYQNGKWQIRDFLIADWEW